MEGQGNTRGREGVSFMDFQRGILQNFAKSDGGMLPGVKFEGVFVKSGYFLKMPSEGGSKNFLLVAKT